MPFGFDWEALASNGVVTTGLVPIAPLKLVVSLGHCLKLKVSVKPGPFGGL
jgi:hypothetical protein